jgi:triosephosphate isomerase (TIM)
MKIFAANWKLNKNPAETRAFLKDFSAQMPSMAAGKDASEIVFFPPAACFEAMAETLPKSMSWGAQNCYQEVSGAFTGENSAKTVKDLGGHYILLGHSERRSLFGETDQILAKKLKLVQSLDLIPMFCIGETLQEREAKQTLSVLKSQLEKGLALIRKDKPIVVAYEPVWAIGTGKVASLDQVKEAHAAIHELLVGMSLDRVPILYGGSVKPDNSKALLAVPLVDGFLVGGASLAVADFLKICQS